jgi:hypothetical protein
MLLHLPIHLLPCKLHRAAGLIQVIPQRLAGRDDDLLPAAELPELVRGKARCALRP